MKDNKRQRQRRRRWDVHLRKVVQVGFLMLFLIPLLPLIVQRSTQQVAPVFTSWLLPWDALLGLGKLLQGRWEWLVVGAPLLLLALSFILGRFFCGWVCPMGTLLDLLGPLLRRVLEPLRKIAHSPQAQTKHTALPQALPEGPRSGHFDVRPWFLIALLSASLFSLQFLGWFDPLVVFQRVSTATVTNLFALRQSPLRVTLAAGSMVFGLMLVLEFWERRVWCRRLCPLGMLLGLAARFSLLNRCVAASCTGCAACAAACPTRAIPPEAPKETRYADCLMCFECESACPRKGIRFVFGREAVDSLRPPKVGRREFLQGTASLAIGAALPLISTTLHNASPMRPPGVLDERAFLRTCIACEECIRACPSGGLRPAFLEAGVQALGTPLFVPRQGACGLGTGCDQLCAQVCPVGALQRIPPPEMRLGVAKVDHRLCLAWDQGAKCLVCVEACLNEAALVYQGRVIIDAQKCTGCSRCESGCPVAGSAIHVLPLARGEGI